MQATPFYVLKSTRFMGKCQPVFSSSVSFAQQVFQLLFADSHAKHGIQPLPIFQDKGKMCIRDSPYSMGQTASYTVPDEETLDFQAAQEESGIVGMGPCFNPAI